MTETKNVVNKPFTSIEFLLEGKILKVQQVTGEKEITRWYDPVLGKVKLAIKKRCNPKVKVLNTFELKETTPNQLKECRKNKIPYFVIKKDGFLFFTEVPKELSFLTCNIMGPHLCAGKEKSCERLRALPDEKGGCKKVRDGCRNIEKYDFLEGFEARGTIQEVFVVTECKNCVYL